MLTKVSVYHICITLLALSAMCACTRVMAASNALLPEPPVATLQNQYIGVAIGNADWYFDTSANSAFLGPDAGRHNLITDPTNTNSESIPTDQWVSGRFYMWTTGGDPTTTEDDNQSLIYDPWIIPLFAGPIGRIATWQIMTDHNSITQKGIQNGSIAPAPLQAVWNGPYPTGGGSAVWGDPSDGWWVTPLVQDDVKGTITGSFEPFELYSGTSSSTSTGSTGTSTGTGTGSGSGNSETYTQTGYGLSVTVPGTGSSGGTGSTTSTTETTNGLSGILCTMEARLLRDTVRWKWTFTNVDTVVRQVGLRLCVDELLEPNDFGTQDAENIVSTGKGPFIRKPTVLSNNDIPSTLELFNSAKSPVISFRHTFSGQGATMPDKVGVDDWMNLADQNALLNPTPSPDPNNFWPTNIAWNYGADYYDHDNPYSLINNFVWLYQTPVQDHIDDLATGAFWAPKPISPGGTLTIIHYTGLACATSDFTTPSEDNPLYVAATQSPATLQYLTDSNGNYELYPTSFNITAYMDNVGSNATTENLTNATCTLILPNGLSLDSSENGQTTKALPDIPVGTEQSVSWKVVPTGGVSGPVQYFVTYNAAPAGGTTVSRDIYIPATDSAPMSTGWQMITVPFSITATDLISALGLTGRATALWEYNAAEGAYEAVSQLVPGKAYWLYMLGPGTASLASIPHTALDWSSNDGYSMQLQEGWNMIGDPYVYSTTIGQASFYTAATGNTVDFDTAVAQGLISPFVFNWGGGATSYSIGSDRNTEMLPWQGYWLRVLQPGVVMIFGPVTQVGASVGAAPANSGGSTPVPPPAPSARRVLQRRGTRL